MRFDTVRTAFHNLLTHGDTDFDFDHDRDFDRDRDFHRDREFDRDRDRSFDRDREFGNPSFGSPRAVVAGRGRWSRSKVAVAAMQRPCDALR